ncbi:hypothetical conserved protein [Candidatus Nitrosoglobus terrae]|uniref:Hypothetical conserved protein n=1 Tax=Candidatus Nitrosoglobus terrae TaxID=1630141 RepID=A0A1Q2SLE7_9GAMM|nr:DUF4340 domain-containing protein [Candidatus Nitrosoglobus terrae]BAW79917.1 hypothetical conserved protein [Candidatus Nitrosoglobus terrae]
MHTRTLLNLALTAIVIVLGLVFFYEPGSKADSPPLTSISSDKIEAIRVIHNESHEEIHLERKEGKWLLTAPIHGPANMLVVKTLLDVAKTKSYSHYPVQNLDLTKLGLSSPKNRLYLNDLAIDFGVTAPLNQNRYVLLADTVHLIDNTAFHTITSAAPKFLDPALLPDHHPISRLQIPQVTISNGNPNVNPKNVITLYQKEGQWVAEGIGIDNPPSSETIATLINAWQQYTVQQIGLKGDKTVLATIEIEQKGASPIHLDLLSDLPQLVLVRSDFGVQYNLPAPAWKTLFELPQGDSGNNKLSSDNKK